MNSAEGHRPVHCPPLPPDASAARRERVCEDGPPLAPSGLEAPPLPGELTAEEARLVVHAVRARRLLPGPGEKLAECDRRALEEALAALEPLVSEGVRLLKSQEPRGKRRAASAGKKKSGKKEPSKKKSSKKKPRETESGKKKASRKKRSKKA